MPQNKEFGPNPERLSSQLHLLKQLFARHISAKHRCICAEEQCGRCCELSMAIAELEKMLGLV